MGLINERIVVKWSNTNRKHYESLGYKWTKNDDEFEIWNYELPKASNTKVRVTCDICGEENFITYASYMRSMRLFGEYRCDKCSSHKKQNKSFYDWCIEKNREDLLELWDYELNNVTPKEVKAGTKKSYYFKCPRKLHDSELRVISIITYNKSPIKGFCKKCHSFGQRCIDNNMTNLLDRWDYDLNKCSPWEIPANGNMKKYWFKCPKGEHDSELFLLATNLVCKCSKCNSLAQWFINNELNIDKYWDYEKNRDTDPWKIPYGGKDEIWIMCQDVEYHGSYKTTCGMFTGGARCPYCNSNGGRVHPKDSLGQYIIDNYGEEFLHSIWSEKNNKTPFEYPVYSMKKVWWKCPDGEHLDFYRSIATSSSNCDFRCSLCSKSEKESTYEKRFKSYLEDLGYKVLTEYDCTLKPINPKTKRVLPYDNEIVLANGKHLIIEIHGQQHYDNKFFKTLNKCSDDEANKLLRYQQVKDRYKKAYALHYGYEYLEIPYTMFIKKNKEGYKQMINEKIEEILKEGFN